MVIFEKGIPWDIQNGASYVSPVVGLDDINPFPPFCLAPFLQNNGVRLSACKLCCQPVNAWKLGRAKRCKFLGNCIYVYVTSGILRTHTGIHPQFCMDLCGMVNENKHVCIIAAYNCDFLTSVSNWETGVCFFMTAL